MGVHIKVQMFIFSLLKSRNPQKFKGYCNNLDNPKAGMYQRSNVVVVFFLGALNLKRNTLRKTNSQSPKKWWQRETTSFLFGN